MNKTEKKDLKYWKNNCEEDYIKTPISVLRYISELEKAITVTHCCKSDSELLKSKERLDYKSWKKAMGYERIEKPVLKKGNVYVELEKVMLEFDEYERTF